MKQEVIVSVDCAADGPLPGMNSLLSIGAVAFDAAGKEIQKFTANLQEYPGASPDHATMEWWYRRAPASLEQIRLNTLDPELATRAFVGWIEGLPGRARFLSAPVAVDFSFLRFYLCRYVGMDDRWHNAIDMRSYVMGCTGSYGGDYRKRITEMAPRPEWKQNGKTRIPLDDAREQGQLFFSLRKVQLRNMRTEAR